jgi:transcriptional regulator with XRE-family HTH domain
MAGRPSKPQNETLFAGRVGAIIRRKRVQRKLSVEQAAELAGVAAPTWYHWEAGRHLPLERLPAIAAALKCSVRTLLPAK